MLREYAKENRKNLTSSEKRLWYFLSNKNLLGHKFRRQHIIGNYIVDFYCSAKKLVVEVDGGQHADSKYDEQRTKDIESKGHKVLRFWNNEINENVEAVLSKISNELESNPPSDISKV